MYFENTLSHKNVLVLRTKNTLYVHIYTTRVHKPHALLYPLQEE